MPVDPDVFDQMTVYKTAVLTWRRDQHQDVWSRIKRWFHWRISSIAFCPRCRDLEPWKILLYRSSPDAFPTFGIHECQTCNIAIASSKFPDFEKVVSKTKRFIWNHAPEEIGDLRRW